MSIDRASAGLFAAGVAFMLAAVVTGQVLEDDIARRQAPSSVSSSPARGVAP